MSKLSIVKRVMDYIKGGDDAKVTRFFSKVEKYNNKQVSIRKESIESLNEKIADAEEAFSEQILSVDPARVGTTESAESYASSYMTELNRSYEAIEALREQVKEIEREISRFETISAKIFG